jgi:hypothetical protein
MKNCAFSCIDEKDQFRAKVKEAESGVDSSDISIWGKADIRFLKKQRPFKVETNDQSFVPG